MQNEIQKNKFIAKYQVLKSEMGQIPMCGGMKMSII